MPEDTLVAIVVSEWNTEITGALLTAAVDTLKENGLTDEGIIIRYVPGSFELPLGAKFLLDNAEPDAVICLGCVIQGETRHFDFICDSVANGIMTLGLEYNTPVIFGVLTPNDMQQAVDRAGGKHGNKGVEAAITAVKMIALQYELETEE
jgi:6,7-dimethyl-8-ribityllumazine synthase